MPRAQVEQRMQRPPAPAVRASPSSPGSGMPVGYVVPSGRRGGEEGRCRRRSHRGQEDIRRAVEHLPAFRGGAMTRRVSRSSPPYGQPRRRMTEWPPSQENASAAISAASAGGVSGDESVGATYRASYRPRAGSAARRKPPPDRYPAPRCPPGQPRRVQAQPPPPTAPAQRARDADGRPNSLITTRAAGAAGSPTAASSVHSRAARAGAPGREPSWRRRTSQPLASSSRRTLAPRTLAAQQQARQAVSLNVTHTRQGSLSALEEPLEARAGTASRLSRPGAACQRPVRLGGRRSGRRRAVDRR